MDHCHFVAYQGIGGAQNSIIEVQSSSTVLDILRFRKVAMLSRQLRRCLEKAEEITGHLYVFGATASELTQHILAEYLNKVDNGGDVPNVVVAYMNKSTLQNSAFSKS